MTMIVPVVPYNPVLLLLFNTQTERWHPILYWECPPPSGKLGDCWRWKSKGHHTVGFTSREDAINSKEGGVMHLCQNQYENKVGGDVYYDIEHHGEWDGQGNPADVTCFDLSKLHKYEPTKKSVQ